MMSAAFPDLEVGLMAQDAAAERHAGWRQGLWQGFDEALALVRDLPPEASAADALRVLVDHREVWQRVVGTSVPVPAAYVRQRPKREG